MEQLLKKIYICLVIIIILLFIIILNQTFNVTVKAEGNTQTATEETTEYDTSKFDNLTVNELISRIEKKEKVLVFVGRSTCGWCVQFLPIVKQAQDDYNFKTVYIDLTKMTEEDRDNLVKKDKTGFIEEKLGATPMILIFENGTLKKGQSGYSDYNTFAEFLEANGYEK